MTSPAAAPAVPDDEISVAAAAPSFEVVARTSVAPSPLNPRKSFDEAKLRELAATMANGVGILEPLIVRPHPAPTSQVHYELVAGERRWRAAAIAALRDVPVMVRRLTDAQVLELMVIENDQREGISPLEEGDGFKRLMTFGFDIDKLASRIGRTRRYIYDRVKLLDLVDDGQALLDQGVITVGHAIVMARESAAVQRAIIGVKRDAFGRLDGPLFEREDTLFTPDEQDEHRAEKKTNRFAGLKARSVRELQAWIDQHVRFDATTPVAGELFADTAAAVEAAPKVVAITYGHYVHPDAKSGSSARVYSVVSWKRADGKERSRTCDLSVLGMVIAGAGRGASFQVCVNKDKCRVHWAADVARKTKKAKQAATRAAAPTTAGKDAQQKADQAKARQAAEQKRREEAAEVRTAAVRLAIGRLADAATAVTPAVMVRATEEFFYGDADDEGFIAHFKLKTRVGRFTGSASPELLAMKPPMLIRALTWAALSSELSSLRDDKLPAWFKARKVDLVACEQEIRKAHAAATAPAKTQAAKKR